MIAQPSVWWDRASNGAFIVAIVWILRALVEYGVTLNLNIRRKRSSPDKRAIT